jgi:transcriptional regulator of nitric oxide reductase
MTGHTDDTAHEGAHALEAAERLLERAERDSTAARPAAVEALKALLLHWDEVPRGGRVAELLAQVAETDDTLQQFSSDAVALDRGNADDAHERAKIFVDAARAPLMNI